MPISVTGPDNVTIAFPDETDASIINDVMMRHFGGGSGSKASPITTGNLVSAALDVPVLGPLARKAEAAVRAIPQVQSSGLVEKLPEATFGERYHHALENLEKPLKKFEAEHPVAAGLANIAGTTAATLPLAATSAGARILGLGGRTLAGQAAQGAASGAAINATDAALRGNDPGMAAVVGGGIGAAAPALARGAGAAIAPLVTTARGIMNPAAEAARRVGTGIEHDIAAGGAGLTQPEFASAAAGGAPVNLMDLGGETTRALARSAANTSPEGRQVLNRAIDDRFEGQAERISDAINSMAHYPDATAQAEALRQSQSAANNANYARAMADGAGGIWNPELERLASSNIVADAMRKASSIAQDEAVMGGYAGMNPKISFTPDGRIQFGRGPTGAPTYPDLQFWDLTRRQLSNGAQMAARTGDMEGARRFGTFAHRLNAELDRAVPSYAAARAGHAAFAGAQDALEAGRNYATQQGFRIDNQAARAALMRMTPQERQLFQDGFASALVQRIRSMPDRRNVLNTIGNSPAAREQMNIALGPQRAAQVEAMLRVEGIMDAARGAVQGNSTTIRQLAELGLAGGASATLGGGNPLSGDPEALLHAALMYGALRGGRAGLATVDQRVATQVARLLTSNDPAQVRLGMNMLGRNRGMLDSLRRFDTALARSVSSRLQ